MMRFSQFIGFMGVLALTFVATIGVLYIVTPPNYNTDYPEYQHCD